jgi:pimeloyl-ACP methyl ester carboxylesterase
MDTGTLEWNWRGEVLRLGTTAAGAGSQVLMLPALSSISTRHEMRPLQERLASEYSTLAVDWPGFGDRSRPRIDWTPEAYSAFLAFALAAMSQHPHAVIAAGHAATYALKHAAHVPQAPARLVLIAPTWRGPLPTMMGGQRPFFARLRRLADLPLLGAGHVYSDAAFLQGERLREKLAVIRAPGARFASVRFVTGGLDQLASREAFLDLGRRAGIPILLVYGAETPPKSRAEMEAFAALPGIRSVILPRGKLAVHEEFPDATAEAVAAFLRGQRPGVATP